MAAEAHVQPGERPQRPPRDGLVRFVVTGEEGQLPAGVALREVHDGSGADGGPVLYGHFTPFNRWTEIDSFFEGNFMERTVPGAFKKTIQENRDNMRVLFQHGRDPQIGSKPLGPISQLREDPDGPYYEVPLLEAPYVRDTLLPGLRAGLYGASYRFRVIREEINDEPGASESNPKGLPERTIKEAQVFEFGPVTFPAFAEASAGVRSGTDDYFLEGLAHSDPDVVRMAAAGATLPMLIAYRLGGRDLGQPLEEIPVGEEGSRAKPGTPEQEGATGAGPEQRNTPPATNRPAAPVSATPLLGVRKESWRL